MNGWYPNSGGIGSDNSMRMFALKWPEGRKVWHNTFSESGVICGYVSYPPTVKTYPAPDFRLLVKRDVNGDKVEWEPKRVRFAQADIANMLKAALYDVKQEPIPAPPAPKEGERGTGAKWDGGKPMFDLLSEDCALAHLGVVQVMTWAVEVKGYKPGSWQTVPEAIKRYGAALDRHQNAKRRGERYDHESGLLHDFHIATNAMFVAELEARVDKARGLKQEYKKTLPAKA